MSRSQERRLQLVHSLTHPGKRGPTLIEKMEQRLDRTIRERQDKQHEWDQGPDEVTDEENDEFLDWMVENAGKIKGMMIMLAIMRSSTVRIETDRSKERRTNG